VRREEKGGKTHSNQVSGRLVGGPAAQTSCLHQFRRKEEGRREGEGRKKGRGKEKGKLTAIK
jgi:hypothetical protein